VRISAKGSSCYSNHTLQDLSKASSVRTGRVPTEKAVNLLIACSPAVLVGRFHTRLRSRL
jgi:hypothetical protein